MSNELSRTEIENLSRHLLFAQMHKYMLGCEPTKATVRPAWQVVLESPSFTALISVLIGGLMAGIVGQYLSYRYQQSLRQRDIATATYEGYLKRDDETITSALVLIGSVMSASEDLMTFAKVAPEPENYPPAVAKRIEARREEIFDAFRDASREWRIKRDQQGLLIQYYSNGNPELISAWRDLQDSVTAYTNCTQRLYWSRSVHGFSPLYVDSCIGERHVLGTRLDCFTALRLKAAREEASPPK